MGRYTDGLFKRKRVKSSSNPRGFEEPQSSESPGQERLVACGIIRDGVTHSYGFKSHAEVRRRMGDEDPYTSKHGDEEGFITSNDRFVSRREANFIAVEVGQSVLMDRKFLSSDVNKW